MMKYSLTEIDREVSDKVRITNALLFAGLFLALCWIVFVMDEYLGFGLKPFGLHPRRLEGLPGIISIHFLHGDLKHIGQNTIGFLVLNTLLFYFYRTIALKVWLRIFFIAPALLWIFGRDANHIGASVLIYGIFSFLMVSGFIRDNPLLTRVSFVVILYYGSLVWYILPVDQQVSWDGHACGFVVGFFLAFVYRAQGPKRKPYQYEMEPELPDDENAYWKIPSQREEEKKQETTVTVRYHFKEKNDQIPGANQ